MTFDAYCKKRELPDAQVALELDCTPECVRLWRKGQRIPRSVSMARIEAWSGGEVTAADFYSGRGPKAEAA